MKPSRAWVVVRLLLVVSLLVPASAGWCAETQERYIKRLGVDDKYINLEVDGEKVRIPLPEGYEVFTKEEYPEPYENMYGPVRLEVSVPLCGLVNSSDHKKRIDNADYVFVRFAFIEIERDYVPHRLSIEQFRNEMEHQKSFNDIIVKEKTTTKEDRFISKYIIDDNTTLTEIRVEKKVSVSDGNVMAYTYTNKLFNKIIFSIRFHTWPKNEADLEILTKETLEYVDLLNGHK